MDLRYVKKLIEMIDDSSVDSIEITTEKGVKIRVAKNPAARPGFSIAAPGPAPYAHVHAEGPRAAVSASPADAATERPKAAASALLEVKSPMVGTFYGAPEPGAKPYVSVGDRVTKGQTLCIIEAMKIMNEIESEYAGVVRETLTLDAQPVEYGQALFRIDPNG
ncbi:MAG: acetyl-CoA carboxylase biotin carboxyl carrier protein [Gemmatimonadota bacterium]